MATERATCASCRHARMGSQLSTTMLLCTAKSPVLHLLPGTAGRNSLGMAGLWPPIDPTDGCGDHQPEGQCLA
jgi:hypothetical protein